MIKQLPLLLLCAFLITGCSKFSDRCPNHKSGYNLGFDVHTVDYTADIRISDPVFLTLEQDLEFGMVTKESAVNYWNNYETSEDSIRITNVFRYTLTDQSLFEYSTFELSFTYLEAKANLTATAEGLYTYNSNELILEAFLSRPWGQKFYRTETKEYNHVEIKILGTEGLWPIGRLLGTDFIYFDDENFILNEVSLDSDSGQLNLSAEFNLNIKVPSCGYFDFYHLRNGHFETVINPCTL